MANNFFVSDTAAAAELSALIAPLNSGYLRLYNGTQPVNANTALSGNTLLAELRFNATSGTVTTNVFTANAITDASSAAATGTASFFRALESNGTTVICDGSVGTSGCDLNLNTTSIVTGADVACSSLTLTLPEH